MKRSLLGVLALVLTGCGAPAPDSPAPSPPIRTSESSPRPPAWLADIPTGPPPRVGYVVDRTYVAPDGTRVDVRRPGRPRLSPAVLDFTVLGDGSLLVQDDDSFEGYTGLRHVVDGRTVASWSTTGFVTGPDGRVAFGEATTSEASVHGPVAVHLLRGSTHLVQEVDDHPSVLAIVGDRVVFSRQFGLPPTLVTDLVGPPARWTGGPLPRTRASRAVREPSGALLKVVLEPGVDRPRSAIVRRLPDGSVEVAAPPRSVPRSAFSIGYVLDRRG